ncbi:MAG: glycosyltransferase family 39 protein [Bacteroidota bacterium]
MTATLQKYTPGLILFLLSVILCGWVYQDYGISWDEPEQKRMGDVSYNYVRKGDKALFTYLDRDHGVGFELPLTIFEKTFIRSGNSRDQYLARHLITHLFFLFAALCGYVLIQKLFKNQFLSCLGYLMLVFDPRLYAQSFFNTKDIPFLSAFIISLTVCHIAFQRNTTRWYILLGIVTGYASSIRILNIYFIFFVSIFFLLDIIQAYKNKSAVKATIKNFALFIIAVVGTLYAFWPLMWRNPIHNFTDVFGHYSHYGWLGQVLFNGKSYTSNHLPAAYIPGWICISTPVLIIVASIIGCITAILAFIRKPWQMLNDRVERNFLLYLFCIVAPVGTIIMLHSSIYDDWRHVYFVYPSLLLLAMYLINKLIQTKFKKWIIAACVAQVIMVGIFMVRNHPYQQVYFNEFISHKDEYLRKNFEMDYWGVAYKQGYEYILKTDPSYNIKIASRNAPLGTNNLLLQPHEQQRFHYVDVKEDPDYILTNFRYNANEEPLPHIYYEVKVLNSTILRVYKMH